MGFEVVQNYSDAGFADLTFSSPAQSDESESEGHISAEESTKPAAEQKSDENPIGRLPRTWR